jgi:hypothetical protein
VFPAQRRTPLKTGLKLFRRYREAMAARRLRSALGDFTKRGKNITRLRTDRQQDAVMHFIVCGTSLA